MGNIKSKIGLIEELYKRLKDEREFRDESIEDIQAIKRKVSSIIIGVHQVQKDIDEILPKVESNTESYGNISWIKDEVASQNKKVQVMYEVMSQLVKHQKR